MSLVSLPIQAALIDLDGTLVDTLGDFTFALNLMMADLGLGDLTPAQVQACIGRGSEHLIRAALGVQMPDATPDRIESLYPQAWERYQEHYRRHNGLHAQVYPGVAEGLQALSAAGLALACLTNKPLAFARDLLAAKGLAGHFSQVFGGDSFERKKPDPLPLLKTCEALGTAPEVTLMVGDSSNDAQAGHAAGCGVVLVSYGYNHGQPIQQTPALAWVDAMTEIVPALAQR